MKEINSLLEKSRNALESAELLLDAKFFDASVSRAYYAMFYAAEALLLSKNLEFSSHKSVISLFGKHFVKTKIFKPEIGRQLNKAFEKRLLGDYSYSSKTQEQTAKEVMNWAKQFLKEAKSSLS